MKNYLKILIGLGILILTMVVIISLNIPKVDVSLGGSSISYPNASSSVFTTTAGEATIVLKANVGRGIAIFQNTTATVAYLAFHATTSPASIPVLEDRYFIVPLSASGGTYEINEDNPYTGQVIASSSAAVTIRVTEIY